jgi:hypothetical protein
MRANGAAGRVLILRRDGVIAPSRTPAQFLGGELLAVERAALGELLRARQRHGDRLEARIPHELACDRDRVRVVARDRDRHRLARAMRLPDEVGDAHRVEGAHHMGAGK